MVDDEIFACTAQSGILDTFLRFHVSEFTQPVSGLVNFSLFPAESNDCDLCIPTVTDLLGNEDIASFAEYPQILQVPLDEVSKTASPLSIFLLTGKVFHGLVTSVCARSNKYGYYCDPIDALNYVQSVARDGDDQYNPFIYFLIAAYQIK